MRSLVSFRHMSTQGGKGPQASQQQGLQQQRAAADVVDVALERSGRGVRVAKHLFREIYTFFGKFTHFWGKFTHFSGNLHLFVGNLHLFVGKLHIF